MNDKAVKNNIEQAGKNKKGIKPTKKLVKATRITLIMSGWIIVLSGFLLNSTGFIANFIQIAEHIGIPIPGAKTPKYSPEWIGTKIGHMYNKKLSSYDSETNLIETDKMTEEYLALRNIDEDISSATGLANKNNSGTFAAHLRRVKEKNIPVCLLIYGKRIPSKSEFKNIIQINRFPEYKINEYDKLEPSMRDTICGEHKDTPGLVIVFPRS